MKVLVTGASGLVGAALVDFLHKSGHTVKKLIRSEWSKDLEGVAWDPDNGPYDPDELEGLDVVVNLAGESIAEGRWNEAKKDRIIKSRVLGTRHLVEAFKTLQIPPKVLINASAVGYYGSQGDTLLNENSPSGKGFLAEVCRQWEHVAEEAGKQGLRVVILRFGMILSPKGGALAKILTPFQLGMGGVLGDGNQYMSWIAIDDVIGIIYHAMTHSELSGPVNAVTPYPVTNKEFTKTLGSILHRPTLMHVPAFGLRFAYGEVADELLLASTRAEPRKLLEAEYHFLYPHLAEALHHVLGR